MESGLRVFHWMQHRSADHAPLSWAASPLSKRALSGASLHPPWRSQRLVMQRPVTEAPWEQQLWQQDQLLTACTRGVLLPLDTIIHVAGQLSFYALSATKLRAKFMGSMKNFIKYVSNTNAITAALCISL